MHGLAPSHEFIRTELICVGGVPSFIQHARAALLGADAVEPVVAGNEIAARIANDGNSHLAHFFHNVLAESVGIREFRAWIKYAFVNRTSQVLQERSKEIAVERRRDAA